MKPAFTLGLRGRLILLLLTVFALLTGLVVWDFVEHRRERIGAASAELLDNTRLIASRTRTFAAQADAILNELMLAQEMQPGSPAGTCAQFIQARTEREPAFNNGGRTLPDGEVVCVAAPPGGRVSYADRSWYQAALRSHEMVVSEVLQGRILGKPLIAFAKSMRDAAGHVTGVLFLSLDLSWLKDELAAAELPEGARLVVVDAQGTVAVRHPDPEVWVGKSAAQLPLFQHMLAAGDEGTEEEVGMDGERRFFAYTKLLDTVSGPMYLWLSVPKTVVEAPARRQALFGIGIVLAVLIGTMGLLVWGGNRLVVRPLLILSQVAARFRAGDLAARTGLPHGDDELGRVARVLDETAAAIEDRERKLARANRALRVLSAGNRALLRSKGEQDLLDDMCRVIVQAGDYRLAWVAYAEDDPVRSVRLVADWAAGKEFLDDLKITWDETEWGRGPTGTAIRRGVPIVSNDIATDPDYALWRGLAQRNGFASALAVPLRLGDSVIGALCICAAESGAFDEDVIELLSEAADDLAFGIAKHRAEIEHGRTRAALQTAEARFRAAAEASLDPLFILKNVRGERGQILDFEFTDINPRAEQMLGMTRGQIIGQKLCELLPFTRAGGFFDKCLAVVATGTPLEEEFPIDTPQIKAEWLRSQVVRVADGIAISFRDITAWKAAGDRLRESEARYRQLFEANPHPMWVYDLATLRFLMVNDAAVKHYGYTRDDFQAMTIADIRPPDDIPRLLENIAQVEDGKTDQAGVWQHRKKDGTLIDVEITSHTFYFEGKRVEMVLAHDVTAQRRAEAERHKSERKFKTVFEQTPVGVVIIDLETGMPMEFNDVAHNQLGYSREEFARLRVSDYEALESVEQVKAHTQEIIRKRGDDFETQHRTKSGELRNVRIMIRVVEFGDQRSLYCIYQDITEKTRIDKKIAQYAEQLKVAFMSTVEVATTISEMRDPYTTGHERRVAEIAVAIGAELGFDERRLEGLRVAGHLHDVGKISIPAEILSKPGKISAIEFQLIQAHARAGYDVLKDVEFPWPVAEVALQHHERMDGSGYPQGLKGEAILLEARIMAVADVIEAMSSHRPYRPGLGIDKALAEVERERGTAYDPVVADACLKLFRERGYALPA